MQLHPAQNTRVIWTGSRLVVSGAVTGSFILKFKCRFLPISDLSVLLGRCRLGCLPCRVLDTDKTAGGRARGRIECWLQIRSPWKATLWVARAADLSSQSGLIHHASHHRPLQLPIPTPQLTYLMLPYEYTAPGSLVGADTINSSVHALFTRSPPTCPSSCGGQPTQHHAGLPSPRSAPRRLSTAVSTTSRALSQQLRTPSC